MQLTPANCTPVTDRLKDRVAIVSGGASGIGRATCIRLVAEGARVVVADRDKTSGEETARSLAGNAVFTSLDVTQRESWEQVTQFTLDTFDALDILVNSAGICHKNTVEGTTLTEWQNMLSINVDGTFFGCQAAVGVMKERGGGAIVNLASVSANQGSADLLAYVASKGAVRALTKEVAAYCGTHGYGIRCNSVHPGTINTPMVSAIFDEDDEDVTAWTHSQAIKRLGAPEEIAAVIAFLASDESSFFDGCRVCYRRRQYGR